MMTKARILVESFMKPIDGSHKYPMCFDTAKQCALICVDKILGEYWSHDTKRRDYWQEVKQEIEKL